MAKEKEYKKVSTARHVAHISKLWQAKDHLLLAQSAGFTEEYKRFYFRDIQAVLIRPSNQVTVWAIVWLVLSACTLAMIYGLKATDSMFLWFCLVFLFLCFLLNFALGPGCVCHLKTAIQTVEMPFTRRRKAEKWVRTLSPLVEALQQDLPEAPLQAQVTTNLQSASHVAAQQAAAVSVPVLKPFKPLIHWVLFSMLALLGLFEISRFFQHSMALYLVEIALELSVSGLSIAALIRQSQTDIPALLRKVTVGTFLFMMLDYLVGLIYGFYLAIRHPDLATDQWKWIKWLASQAPDSSNFSLGYSGLMILGGLLLGLVGLAELGFHQQRRSSRGTVPA